MIKQINNPLWFKLNGLLREFIIRGGCRYVTDHYIINEYPKSGGSWLGQMIGDALDLPFPRNMLPTVRSSIMHGHYINPWNMKNVCILWRDGRDVVVSQYYYSLFVNDKGNKKLVELTRENFQVNNYKDIYANLPKFIHLVYKDKLYPRFSWSEFVDTWAHRNIVHVKYEDLRINTANELIRIIKELSGELLSEKKATKIADNYSFEKQAGRKPGEERIKNFMRKGIVGDWKNHFSQESKDVFNYYAGDALIKLGYEKNKNWI